MSKFATGVTVVLAENNKNVHGMTANAFMSVSLNPKLILVSISKKAKMQQYLKKTNQFSINILSNKQQDISKTFAGQNNSNIEINNFLYRQNVPIISDSVATLVCTTYKTVDAGDHVLYIGEVIDIMVRNDQPLIYLEGSYMQTMQHT